MKLRILFISRNYPPRVGGLETFSFNLIREFEKHDATFKIVLGKSYLNLVWFLPYCLVRAFFLTRKYNIHLIHLCDGFLAPVGVLLKILTRVRVLTSIAGLDITYPHPLYQRIIPWCVARLDHIICISHATRDACVQRGVPISKCTVIPVGVRPEENYMTASKIELRLKFEQLYGIPLEDKTILLTLGRLVKRKGVAWFVESVLPNLEPSYHYLVIGDGPELPHLRNIIEGKDLGNRVSLIGSVTDERKREALNLADMFIMPNITVPGDVEGFGIVVIEAGSCGVPVIASDLQGIRDAVVEGETGYLVAEGNGEEFIRRIENMDLDRNRVRSIVTAKFGWDRIYSRYRLAFTRSAGGPAPATGG